jgi:SAM-dependent methyltransferase
LLDSDWIKRLMAEGSIPRSAPATHIPTGLDSGDWFWLEHEALPFPCHAHEIIPLQLHDAAKLTLDIALLAAADGWILKDASAWNVLHSRGRPLFVDILSFDRQGPQPHWAAYGQFVRHFLLPLFLHRKLRLMPADFFVSYRDGITPERAYDMLRGVGLLSPMALEFVALPKWLSGAGERLIEKQSRTPRVGSVRTSGNDAVVRTLNHLQRRLSQICPKAAVDSVWKDYEKDRTHYTEDDLAAKRRFVSTALGACETVLDLGCNAGEFSFIAAAQGKSVVAADSDYGALSKLYGRIRLSPVDVTPVALNIGRPTPAVGWMNSEIPSFVERAAGQFECVLALGLIHHLLIRERAPLAKIVELLASLAWRSVILEWVDPADPKFQAIAGLDKALYSHLNASALEESMRSRFKLADKLVLPSGTRLMYLWIRG